jgi:hypothetical protein
MARLAPSDFESKPEPTSVPGSSFVKDSFIDGDYCRQIAPFHFEREKFGRTGSMHRQSLTLQDERACRDPLDTFPIETVGYKLY